MRVPVDPPLLLLGQSSSISREYADSLPDGDYSSQFARIVQETEHNSAKVEIEVRVLVWAPFCKSSSVGFRAFPSEGKGRGFESHLLRHFVGNMSSYTNSGRHGNQQLTSQEGNSPPTNIFRARSSVGRAPRLQRGCRRFKSCRVQFRENKLPPRGSERVGEYLAESL